MVWLILQLSDDEERSSQASSEVTSISQPAQASRKRGRADSSAVEAVASMSQVIQGLSKRRSERREALDQFDSFGSTVAGIIRSLPPQNSLTAMMKVLEVLQPLQHIHTTASPSATPPSHHAPAHQLYPTSHSPLQNFSPHTSTAHQIPEQPHPSPHTPTANYTPSRPHQMFTLPQTPRAQHAPTQFCPSPNSSAANYPPRHTNTAPDLHSNVLSSYTVPDME